MSQAASPDPHRPTIVDRLARLPVTNLHKRATLVIGIGFFFDLYESFLSGILAVVVTEKLPGAGAAAKPLLVASIYIGSFFGAVTLSRLADRLGRRRAFLITIAGYSLFSLLGAASTSVWMLILARFLAGVGVGAELPLGATYLADLMPPWARGRFVAWAFTVGFCGMPVAGLAGRALQPHAPLGLAGWRWMLILGAVGALVVWLLRRSLPESPRWLAARGRHREADAAVTKFELSAQRSGLQPVPAPPTPAASTSGTTRSPLREAFRPPWRRRTVMLWIFHVVQTMGYYGFGTMVPLVLAAKGYEVTSTLTFTALSYAGYPIGSLISVPLMERVQRKWLVIGGATAMVVLGLVFGFATAPTVIVASGFAYTVASNFFSNAYHAYEVELFPTSIRATAAGTAYSLSRLTNAAMPFVLVPLLHAAGAGTLFAVIVAAMVVVIIDIGLLGPNTTGMDLDRLPSETSDPAEHV